MMAASLAAAKRQNAYVENSLLAVLPGPQYESLLADLKPVQLRARQVIYEPLSMITQCYFPNDALLSLMSVTEQGASVAVGMAGREGLIGAAALLEQKLLPYSVIVQCGGGALRISVESLKARLSQNDILRSRILRYIHALFRQVVQTAACNRFHTTEQRLSRWLLSARSRLKRDTLPFTQEWLSLMIGTDRASITRAAQKLKKQGLIDYSRGKTTIIDPERLSSAGCECYRVLQLEYEDLLNL